jgi:exopolysaccharide biosynthesis WecB/TagA/CpsF family protein
MREWPRSQLLNVWVDDLTMRELMDRLDSGVLFTLNLDHIYHLQRNAEFLASYRQADIITCDSKYVYWSLSLLGRGIKEKLSGSDIVPNFCEYHKNNASMRIFLLGASPGTANKAKERINDRAGRELVVAACSPSMTFGNDPAEIQSVIRTINESGATVLMVGLGAPKQEIWITRYRKEMPSVRIFMAVGATIDYEAKTVVRAPRWMTENGLEWFYRLVTEPRRLWRRYLRDLEFFWLVLMEGLGLYREPALPNAEVRKK